MCQPKFFGDDHDGTSFEAVFNFNVNNHGNRARRLFLCWIVAFGVTRGCLLVRGIPGFHRSLEPAPQTWTLFSASSFDCNFRPNNNQTFILYVKSTLVLYRKCLCGLFPVLGFALEETLCGAKCCKFYGPEGVEFSSSDYASAISSVRNSLIFVMTTTTTTNRSTTTTYHYYYWRGPTTAMTTTTTNEEDEEASNGIQNDVDRTGTSSRTLHCPQKKKKKQLE